ncbi:beta strand repeat-containing protein, partial [Solemya elarraichensis gill symbiont]
TVRITAYANPGYDDATADVDHNLIENSVHIEGNDTFGVHLGSCAYSAGNGNDGESEVGYNSVNNTGGIESDITGLQFLAIAGGYSGADASVNSNVVDNAADAYIVGGGLSGVDMTAFAATSGCCGPVGDADASVEDNSITNDGYLGDSFLSGASMNAIAIGENADTIVARNTIINTDEMFGFLSGTALNAISVGEDATAEIAANSIDNSGGIYSYVAGVMVNSVAFSGEDSEAIVVGNTINNAANSTIGSYKYGSGAFAGIMVNAIAISKYSSPFVEADAKINGNEITNAENGVIEGRFNGIALRAMGEDIMSEGDVTVNGNMISNDGLVFAGEDKYTDSAVKLAAYGNLTNIDLFGDSYSAPLANDTEVNGNTITNSGTGAMVNAGEIVLDSAVSLRADSTTGDRGGAFGKYASAEVNSNLIENAGFIGSYAVINLGGGIELTARAGGDAYDSGTSSGGGFEDDYVGLAGSADVNNNTITNSSSESIHVAAAYELIDADGIALNADASVDMYRSETVSGGFGSNVADIGSYSYAGDADVEGNLVENSGSIEVTGHMGEDSQGIVLAADAWAYAGSDARAYAPSGSATANANSDASGGVAQVNNNEVINSGTITTYGEDLNDSGYMQGILLTSSASAGADSNTLATGVSGGYASGGATAEAGTAEVHNNNVVNSGTIDTGAHYSTGIELSAFAWADAESSVSASSSDTKYAQASGGNASVFDNNISNSGNISTVNGEDSTGILLYADASAWAWSDGGSEHAQAGIAEVADNSIDNSGIIQAWEGIVLEARAYHPLRTIPVRSVRHT